MMGRVGGIALGVGPGETLCGGPGRRNRGWLGVGEQLLAVGWAGVVHGHRVLERFYCIGCCRGVGDGAVLAEGLTVFGNGLGCVRGLVVIWVVSCAEGR